MKHKHHLPDELELEDKHIEEIAPGVGLIATIDGVLGRDLSKRVAESTDRKILIIGAGCVDVHPICSIDPIVEYMEDNLGVPFRFHGEDADNKVSIAKDEFLSNLQKREPKHQTHRKHYKFHR